MYVFYIHTETRTLQYNFTLYEHTKEAHIFTCKQTLLHTATYTHCHYVPPPVCFALSYLQSLHCSNPLRSWKCLIISVQYVELWTWLTHIPCPHPLPGCMTNSLDVGAEDLTDGSPCQMFPLPPLLHVWVNQVCLAASFLKWGVVSRVVICWRIAILRQQKVIAPLTNKNLVLNQWHSIFLLFKGRIIQIVRCAYIGGFTMRRWSACAGTWLLKGMGDDTDWFNLCHAQNTPMFN